MEVATCIVGSLTLYCTCTCNMAAVILKKGDSLVEYTTLVFMGRILVMYIHVYSPQAITMTVLLPCTYMYQVIRYVA